MVPFILAVIGGIAGLVLLVTTAPAWIAWIGYDLYRSHPSVLERRDSRTAQRLYEDALSLTAQDIFPTVSDFGPEMLVAVLAETQHHVPPEPVIHALMDCARQLYATEDFAPPSVPRPPPFLRSVEGG